ncbi:glycosyltransferase [Gordonia pseudamarae]|mgnify:CR=1 FL=1|jgi:glycosyltransferase involved in cell wall biosynthesis|uniref:Glycosyltransferase n=1 Tax=Gordonia pseudamarae TaxID=2831662 RepID=A0ABX6IJ06_9ACTN|nr:MULTISPECIES: glycosyltransferase [Gordonia]MBD0022443.1 glycosyltransferase [Gordonia sp. (in: high G+C Gram-positive bacteria)]QHN26368.1 glycosyltransferase [Gordonia pseudamarae]QHN35260.1 glycosyltransferase [Gordonia pseudamarae]
MTHLMIGMDALDSLGGVQSVIRILAGAFDDDGDRVELVEIEPANPRFDLLTVPPLPRYTLSPVPTALPYEPTTAVRTAKLVVRGYRDGLRIRKAGVRALTGLATAHPEAVWLLMQWRLVEMAVDAGLGRRVIGQYHDCVTTAAANGDLARIIRTGPHLAATCALTEADAARLREHGVPRVYAVTNPVPRPPAAPDAAVRTDTVVAAGRFVPQKNFVSLVRAWGLLGGARTGWRLRIIGAGPQEREIREAVTRVGVADSVTVEPPRTDLPDVLRSASLYAMSSRHEGLPMVLTEAMALGVPFVSTPCSAGVAELADGARAGLLARTHAPADLAATIARALTDPSLRAELGAHGRQLIGGREPGAVIGHWRTLFVELGMTDDSTTDTKTAPL